MLMIFENCEDIMKLMPALPYGIYSVFLHHVTMALYKEVKLSKAII
jgi:hypothetical protein